MVRRNEQPSLYSRGGIWYVDAWVGNGRRLRVTTGTRDAERAAVLAESMIAKAKGDTDGLTGFALSSDEELLNYLRVGRERAIRRDRQRGRAPELTPEDLRTLYRRAGGRCEITGIRFSLTKCNGTARRPLAPSIDRIDCSVPYSLDNCRLVLLAVNIAINEWGEGLFRTIAAATIAPKLVTKVDTERRLVEEIPLFINTPR